MLGQRIRWAVALVAVTAALALFGIARVEAITYGWVDDNRHPTVGLLEVGLTNGRVVQMCSGTLIAPTVFLTAAHCTAPIDNAQTQGRVAWVAVSFQSEPPHAPHRHYGTQVTNPNYTELGVDRGDVAVVVLDQQVIGIVPARLPTAGMFDAWYGAERREVKNLKFTAVGFGGLEPIRGGGPPVFPTSGDKRYYALSEFAAMDKVWLHLQGNQATGDGGTCYGDSGGPNFLWQDGEETDIIAGVTVKGDMMCVATNVIYRLDIPVARDFLGQFVTLP
jgi:hypothetical protein